MVQTFVIEKPTWPTQIQKGQPHIYTVDIHPDCTRFAIALFKDGYIFRMNNLIGNKEDSESKNKKDNTIELSSSVNLQLVDVNPKDELLAKLDNHTLTINCLRFSPNGRFISCASDDHKVSLYLYDPDAMPIMGEKESWRCIKVFSGHTGDVLGIDWSHDSRFIASCGVDNNICVYDVERKTLVTTLSMDGIAKGIAWDPIGKYLVSQGDKSVVIWNANTWTKFAEINEPYVLSHGNNMFYRCSWSPDGQYIATANGLWKKKHVAPIISRKDFIPATEITGHSDFVAVAKYSPAIYEDPKDKSMITLVALGSMDNSLSIWNINSRKPLFLASYIVKGGITDIAWARNGSFLICSSIDNSITVIQFPEGFFGKAMTSTQMDALLKEKYGELGTERTLLEAPLLGALADDSESFYSNGRNQKDSQAQSSLSRIREYVPKQREGRTKDGKRRIVPIVLNALPTSKSSPPAQPRPTTTTTSRAIEARLNGETSIEPTQQHNNRDIRPVVTDARNVHVVSKKRPSSQDQESLARQAKKRRVETTFEEFIPESLYIKINANEELKCSVEGVIQYLKNQVPLWSANIGEAPANAAANESFIAVAGSMHSVHIFSKAGRRLLPPIIVDGFPKHICCNKDRHLAIITSEQMLYLWDVLASKCISCGSAQHITHRDPHEIRDIDDIGVTASGIPVITLSNGNSYSYSENLKTWLCIADAHAPLSSFISSATHLYDNNDSEENYENVTYRFLKTKAARLAEQKRMEMLSNGEQNDITQPYMLQTIEDLEIGLAATSALNDADGYMHFIKAYANQISKTDDTERLRDLCDSLLGPIRKSSDEAAKDWDPYIAGIPKRKILDKLLTLVSSNLAFQRIIVEYKDMLSSVNLLNN